MPRVVAGPPSHAAPSTYKLAPAEAFVPESVTATFDGSGAGGAFLPTLSIYSQDGKLIARSPAISVAAGSSAEVTFAPLLRAAQVAAAGAGFPWAQAGIGGAYNVASGVSTEFGIDPGTLLTTDASLFGEDITAGGVTGVKLKAAGTWLGVWGVKYAKLANPQLANPENFVAYAQDVSSSIFVGLDQLGSLYGRGFNDIAASNAWAPGWSSLFTTHGATAAGDPVRFVGQQSTGVTLQVYTQVLVFQILPTAIF